MAVTDREYKIADIDEPQHLTAGYSLLDQERLSTRP